MKATHRRKMRQCMESRAVHQGMVTGNSENERETCRHGYNIGMVFLLSGGYDRGSLLNENGRRQNEKDETGHECGSGCVKNTAILGEGATVQFHATLMVDGHQIVAPK